MIWKTASARPALLPAACCWASAPRCIRCMRSQITRSRLLPNTPPTPNWIFSHLLQFAGAVLCLLAFMLLLSRQLRVSIRCCAGGQRRRDREPCGGGSVASSRRRRAEGGGGRLGRGAGRGKGPRHFRRPLPCARSRSGSPACSASCSARPRHLRPAALWRRPLSRLDRRRRGGERHRLRRRRHRHGAEGGFSPTAMNIQMPASLMVLTWIVGVAAILWRRSNIPQPPAR